MLKRSTWLLIGIIAVPVVASLILAKRPHAFDATPKDAIPKDAPSCDGREDVKFGQFLARFKSDPTFRESRTIFPLHYVFRDLSPEGMTYLSPEEFRKRNWTIVVGDEKAARLRGADRCDEKIEWVGSEIMEVTQHACGDDTLTTHYEFSANLSEARHGSFCYFLKQVRRYQYPFDIR